MTETTGWLPGATAPKDEAILCFTFDDGDGPRIDIGRWAAWPEEGCEEMMFVMNQGDAWSEPDFWMYLPCPPESP